MLKTCCNVLTELGILVLIIFPPIFFGAVLPLHTSIIQAIIWGLGGIFLLKFWLKRSITYIPGAVEFPLVLFFLWGIVNLLVSTYSHSSEQELYKLLYYAVLYGIVLQYVKTIRRLIGLAFIIVLVGSGEAIFGLWQYLRGATTVLGHATPNIGTVNATYFSHNHFAGFLILIIPVTLGLLIGSSSLEKKGFLFLLTSIMGAALVLSLSRGGLLSITIALGGFVICLAIKKFQETGAWIRHILLPVLIIGCVAGSIWGIGISPIAHRSLPDTLLLGTQDFEEEIRFSLWRNALSVVKEFPLWGSGLGTFEYVFQRYRPVTLGQHQQAYHAHNDYLELLIEMGFPALVIVLWGISRFYRHGLRAYFRHRDPALTSLLLGGLMSCSAMFIHSAFDFNLQIPANALLFVIVLAMTTATANFLAQSRHHAHADTPSPFKHFLSALFWYLKSPRYQIHTSWQLILSGIGILGLLGLTFRAPLADRYYSQGRTFHNTGVFLLAIPRYQKAIAIDSDNAIYYEALGQLYRDLGTTTPHAEKWQAFALEAFQQASRLNPYQASYYYQAGQVYDALDEESAAIQAFKTAVQYNPRLAFYHENLGHYLLYLQQTRPALSAYTNALELDSSRMPDILATCQKYQVPYDTYQQLIPNDAHVRKQFAEWLARNDLWPFSKIEYQRAIELSGFQTAYYEVMLAACRQRQDLECLRMGWRELARQDPERPDMLLNVAESFARQHQWETAIHEYETLFERFPDNPDIYQRLGQLYQRQGQWEQAIRHYQALLTRIPENPDLYHALAGLYREREQWQEAIAVYMTALATGPTQPQILVELARLHEHEDETEQALAYYEQAIQAGETRFKVYQHIEQLYQHTGQAHKQVVLWDLYVMANAQKPAALFALAKHYHEQGEWLNAVTLSKEIIANAPTNAAYRIFLADLYLHQGMIREAIAQWEKIVTIHAKNIDYHLRLATLYENVEEWRNARTQYRRILTIAPAHQQARQKLDALGGS